jgi:energy-coupling factor transporter ATP-binding protein EcfA2
MFVRSWQRLQEARTSAARIDDILSASEPPPSASEKWLAAAAAAAGGGGKGAPAAGTGPLPLRGTVELRGGRYGWPGGALSAAAAADAAPGHGGARSDAGTDAAASDGGGGGDDEAGGSYGIDMQPAFSFVSKASSEPRGGGDGGGGAGGVAIHDMELLIRPGQLLGICGSTGAGKSSLLACLLGELEERSPGSSAHLGGAAAAAALERAASASAALGGAAAAAGGLGGSGGAAGAGRAASAAPALGGGDGDGRGGKDPAVLGDLFSSDKVVVAGRTALVSQQPWVAFGTLRENITLGAPEGAPCAHGRAAARRERRVLATLQAAPGGDPGGRHGHHGRGGSGSGSGSRDAERKLEAALYNSVVEACALTNDLLTLAAGGWGHWGRARTGGWGARAGAPEARSRGSKAAAVGDAQRRWSDIAVARMLAPIVLRRRRPTVDRLGPALTPLAAPGLAARRRPDTPGRRRQQPLGRPGAAQGAAAPLHCAQLVYASARPHPPCPSPSPPEAPAALPRRRAEARSFHTATPATSET